MAQHTHTHTQNRHHRTLLFGTQRFMTSRNHPAQEFNNSWPLGDRSRVRQVFKIGRDGTWVCWDVRACSWAGPPWACWPCCCPACSSLEPWPDPSHDAAPGSTQHNTQIRTVRGNYTQRTESGVTPAERVQSRSAQDRACRAAFIRIVQWKQDFNSAESLTHWCFWKRATKH